MSHIGHTCVNNAVRIWLPTIIKVLSAWYSTRDKKPPVPERYYTEDNCPSGATSVYGWPLVHRGPYSEMSLKSLALNATYVLHAITVPYQLTIVIMVVHA